MSSQDSLEKIYSVLFDSTLINFFDYTKLYDDGKMYHICSNQPYKKYFIKNKFYESYFNDLKPGILLHNVSIINTNSHTKSIFEIDYLLSISFRNENNYEVFTFGANIQNSEVLNFYLHNLDCLIKFCFYFKENAHALIKDLENYCIKIPNYKPFIPIEPKNTFNRKDFIKKITTSNQYLLDNLKLKGTKLSKRQSEILYLSIRGKTSPEISEILKLSKRTVNHYLDAIKIKMGASSKSELIEKVVGYLESY